MVKFIETVPNETHRDYIESHRDARADRAPQIAPQNTSFTRTSLLSAKFDNVDISISNHNNGRDETDRTPRSIRKYRKPSFSSKRILADLVR